MVSFLVTGDNLVIHVAGKPHSVGKSHINYAKIKAGLRTLTEDELLRLIDVPEHIKHTLVDHTVEVKNGTVFVDGQPIRNATATRLLEFMEQDFPVDHLVKFIENIYKNPSDSSIAELYGFLEKNSLPITENGCFLAYKVVGPEYLDKHSKTFDNSIGKRVSMPREQVNPDRNQTCSTGLHVCSLSYISDFVGEGDHKMVVEVNPKDVVSVPIDYNEAKMRVCEYLVVAELDADKVIKDTYSNTQEYHDSDEDELEEQDSTDQGELIEEIRATMKAYARGKKVGIGKILTTTEGQRRKLLEHLADHFNLDDDFIDDADLSMAWTEENVVACLVDEDKKRTVRIDPIVRRG